MMKLQVHHLLCLATLLLMSGLLIPGSGQAASNELRRLIEQSQSSTTPLPPVLLSSIHRLQVEGTDPEPGEIAHYRQWIEWLSRSPTKLGYSTFVNEPLSVGMTDHIRQIYHVGVGIQSGGGIVLASHWQHSIEFQTQDPSRENFVRIATKRSGVRFGSARTVMSGIYAGLDAGQSMPFFPVESGELRAGDEITIEYRNLQLPTYASESFVLPIYFKLTNQGRYFLAPVAPLQVTAGKVANLDVIVPGQISPGQVFDAEIILRDEYGNLASGRHPSFDVLLEGIFHSRVPAGTNNFYLIPGLSFDAGGEPEIEVRSSGGGIVGKSNPFVVGEEVNWQILWGETHRHSSAGEGVSKINEAPRSQGLDFAISATHIEYLSEGTWSDLAQPKSWVWGKDLKAGGQQLVISNQYFVDAPRQRELVRRLTPGSATLVALPESPVDDRFLDNQVTRLVEIVSRDSHFEWYANRLLSRGYRLGFTGSSHSHLLPLEQAPRAALTAVILKGDETWQDAMSQRRTYVTTGERTWLKVELNGTEPGQRIANDPRRVIKGEVRASSALHLIELIKNGEVLERLNLAEDLQSNTVKVSFYSDSRPASGQRDLPRNGREWIGFLQLTNASILRADSPGFRIPARQALVINPNNANRIDFITWTRGNSSSFLVDVDTANEDAILELNLRKGHEDVDVRPETRPSSSISSSKYQVSLFDLRNYPVVRTMNVAGYEDMVTFELVNRGAKRTAKFEFVDQSAVRQGDYYYIRITQLDDQMAWSSPIFVGGSDHP
ncbi:MAG: hypothetical protein ABGY96_19280 [bacterium]|nr:hypothetical protein [Gammaproteobacteria bacterium]